MVWSTEQMLTHKKEMKKRSMWNFQREREPIVKDILI